MAEALEWEQGETEDQGDGVKRGAGKPQTLLGMSTWQIPECLGLPRAFWRRWLSVDLIAVGGRTVKTRDLISAPCHIN